MLAKGIAGSACTCSRAGRVYVASSDGGLWVRPLILVEHFGIPRRQGPRGWAEEFNFPCSVVQVVDAGPDMRAQPPRVVRLVGLQLPAGAVSVAAAAIALSPDQRQLAIVTQGGEMHCFWLAPDGTLAEPVAKHGAARLPPGAVRGACVGRAAASTSVAEGEMLLASTNGVFGRTPTGGWSALDLNGTPAVTAAHSAGSGRQAAQAGGVSAVAIGSGRLGDAIWPAVVPGVEYNNSRCVLYLTCGEGGVWRRRCGDLAAVVSSEDVPRGAAGHGGGVISGRL